VKELKEQHQFLKNTLTKAAEEVLHKTKSNAGKCHVSQDERKEIDHEAKVASQRSDRKTLHLLADVLTVRLQQLEPLSGINKERFFNCEKQKVKWPNHF